MKIYDLRINSTGKAEPMNDGFFEHCDNLVGKHDPDKYMMIGNYRISKADWEVPARKNIFEKYLKRQGVIEMTKKEFIEAAKIENDSTNIWATVNGTQANISIDEVMDGKSEKEPFEASAILEADPEHEAWDSLYEDYLAQVEQ